MHIASRAVVWQNAETRQVEWLEVLTRLTTQLVHTLHPVACSNFKAYISDSFDLHIRRLGARDPRTCAAHAHFVLLAACANLSRMREEQWDTVQELGNIVREASTINLSHMMSRKYFDVIMAVISTLGAVGDMNCARRAVAYMEDVAEPEMRSNVTLHRSALELQSSAGTVIQKMFNMRFRFQRKLRKLETMDYAYRIGIAIEEAKFCQLLTLVEKESSSRILLITAEAEASKEMQTGLRIKSKMRKQ